jgi:2-polyprenyl-3-methyl-5-hydroxy-6-metoxy-1,4-benzoquinol methylase
MESARVHIIREWNHEYEHTYASGKHLLWGKEPEGFVKTIVRKVRADSLSLLDLGCGEGRHCAYLASLGFQIVGLDISRIALRKALELRDSCKVAFEIVLGDCLHLPFTPP